MENSKRKYIEATYELLRDEGLESATIRNVAKRVGCSNPAIYRHFRDLDELISIASLRFLHDYSEDARTLSQVDLNPLELNLQLWECLAYYSFEYAPIMKRFFFPKNPETSFHKADVEEYYRCFPEDIVDFKSFMLDMFQNWDLRKRNSILLHRAVENGMLDADVADRLIDIDILLFRGMLASLENTYRDKNAARAAARRFMQLIVEDYQLRLKPGFSILVVTPESPSLRIDKIVDGASEYRVVPNHPDSAQNDDNASQEKGSV